jgi:hypothetical protein
MRVVYFIRDPRGGEIKIGLAQRSRLQQRSELMQLGNPGELELLGLIPARNSAALVRELRAAFSDAQIRGDWYEPIPELLEYIRSRAVTP